MFDRLLPPARLSLSMIARLALGVAIAALTVGPVPAQAQEVPSPNTISQQGLLTDDQGTPLNGTFEMTFSLIEGEQSVFSETHQVEVTDGRYNVQIGDDTQFPSGTFFPSEIFFPSETFFPDEIFFPSEIFLRTEVEGETLSPDRPLSSTPYAFLASGLFNEGNLPIITDGNASIHVNNDASGEAGQFAIFRGDGTTPFLKVNENSEGTPQMVAAGRVLASEGGRFTVDNNSSTALVGLQTGTGRAGVFEIENPSSGASVLESSTAGQGLAADLSSPNRGDPRGNPEAHVARVQNTNSNDGGDVLAVQAGEGASNVGSNTNFISFYDTGGTIMGTVQGNGSGGIELTGTGADFAEELPVAKGAPVPGPAEVVGVRGGTVSLDTEGADRVMIASSAPAVTGNATPQVKADDARRVKVAFVGQVPVRLRGAANVGDLIVASGRSDGTARAISPSEYRREEHGPIAGQAWSAKSTSDVGEVTAAVGLGQSGIVAKQLQAQQRQIDELRERVQQVERLQERVARLEAGAQSRSVLAGLPASGLLIALLATGLLGTGLFWRLRTRRRGLVSRRPERR